MSKTFIITLFSLVLGLNSIAQEEDKKEKPGFFKRYINKIVDNNTAQEKAEFFLYPTIGYKPETNIEFGFSPLYVYYAKEDTDNRLSEVNGYGFITLQKQYGARINHALYSHEDKWFFLGDIDFQQFPLKYYGIGNSVPEDNIALVDATQFIIKERVLRRVLENFYVGLETDFRSFENAKFEDPDGDPVEFDLPFGAEGTTNFGIGAGVVFDERHNVLNERNAFFTEVAYLNYSPFWKDKVEYQSITSDSRFFKTVGENNVIAAQLLGEFNFAGSVPFSQLSFMGGQNMMRGYFKGRFRDKNQIAAQVEYRMLPLDLGFSNRLGATVFTSVGDVFEDWNELSSKEIKMAAGVGVRFLLFQQKDVYLRFDYAITPDENGFYIGVGEAF